MSGGKLNVPLVLRTNLGATRRSAAQHSQSLHALVAHIPGPEGRPAVIGLRGQGADEDGDPRQQPGRHLRRQADVPGQGPVPEEEYLIPFGEANVKREGSDITLIATSSMVQVAEKAAEMLPRKASRRGDRSRAPSCRSTRPR
jgi:pyruvate/2-oxoglutarate/acetoin dehydrogenase E1 component